MSTVDLVGLPASPKPSSRRVSSQTSSREHKRPSSPHAIKLSGEKAAARWESASFRSNKSESAKRPNFRYNEKLSRQKRGGTDAMLRTPRQIEAMGKRADAEAMGNGEIYAMRCSTPLHGSQTNSIQRRPTAAENIAGETAARPLAHHLPRPVAAAEMEIEGGQPVESHEEEGESFKSAKSNRSNEGSSCENGRSNEAQAARSSRSQRMSPPALRKPALMRPALTKPALTKPADSVVLPPTQLANQSGSERRNQPLLPPPPLLPPSPPTLYTLPPRPTFQKRILGSAKLFEKLTEAEMQSLLASISEVRFTTGDQIVTQGDTLANTLYIIRTGAVRVSAHKEGSGHNGEREIAELTTGDYFGEMALLGEDCAPRSATVTALVPTVCSTIDVETFERVVMGPMSHEMHETAERRKAELEEKLALDAFKMEDLSEVGVLGYGTYGTVTLVEHIPSGNVYALKAMRKKQLIALKSVEHVRREKTISYACSHPFLLRLVGAFQDSVRLFMVLEPAMGGEVFSLMECGMFPEPMAGFYGASVCLAFEHMHDRHIAYRDLKPENLLLDARGYVKICDFGFAKIVYDATYTLCGTPEYLAPEIIQCTGHSTPVDWWALGVLMFEMLSAEGPFAGDTPLDMYKNILRGHVKYPKLVGKTAIALITSLLHVKVIHRLGSVHDGDVLKHAFFRTIDTKQLLMQTIKPPWEPQIHSKHDLSHFRGVDLKSSTELGLDRTEWNSPPDPHEQRQFDSFSMDVAPSLSRPESIAQKQHRLEAALPRGSIA